MQKLRFLFLLVIPVSLFTMENTLGSVDQKLEYICQNCLAEENIRLDEYKSFFDTDFTDTKAQKDVLIIFKENRTQNWYEYNIQKKLIQRLLTTNIGQNLLLRKSGSRRFKMFYHLSTGNQENNFSPLWKIEQNNPHDLFGFFTAKGDQSVMALNAYQDFEIAATTYLHESFHLYDPYVHDLAKKGNYSKTEEFIGEYRAALAELEYVRQKVKVNEQSTFVDFEDFSYHERFFKRSGLFGTTINYDEIDYDLLYQHLLSTHYPLSSSDEWRVDTNSQIEIYFHNKASGEPVIESIEPSSSKIGHTMQIILNKYLDSDKENQPTIIAKVRYKKQKNKEISEVNKKIQAKIKKEIGKDIKKYLEARNLLDSKSLMSTPVEGIVFGPKDRGKGD